MIRGFDVSSMIVEILQSGVSLREITDRLGAGNFSEKLLKHYLKGGVPNLHRGNIIVGLWCTATGKSESEAPKLDWQPAYRIDQNREADTMRPKCLHCGQTLRGQRATTWEQLQIHHGQYGDPGVVPSWLAPRPVQHTEFQGRARRVQLSDDETTGTLL